MHAEISGQLGLALLDEGRQTFLLNIDEPEAVRLVTREYGYRLFRDAGDRRTLKSANRSEVWKSLKLAWSQDRALQLLLIALDHAETLELRHEAIEFVESQLDQTEIVDFLNARLWSSPMPDEADLLGTIGLASTALRLKSLLESVRDHQFQIQCVREAWDNLHDHGLEDPGAKRQIEDRLIALGVFYRLAAADPSSIDAALFDCLKNSSVSRMPHSRQWLTAWIAPLKVRPASRPVVSQGDDFDETETELPRVKPGRFIPVDQQPHARRLRAEKEVASALEMIARGELARAETFTRQLAERQVSEGDSEFAAKSLCKVAQACKEHRDFELQLRLSEEAYRVYPEDPQCGNHFAEALRTTGQPDRALPVYRQVVDQFPNNAVSANGLAETLRDLGRHSEALTQYQDNVRRFPNNEVSACGLAETLRDLGRHAEALAQYQDNVRRFPNNDVSACGLAETLRDLGRHAEALTQYQDNVRRFPNSGYAKGGLASVWMDLSEFRKALEIVESSQKGERVNWVLEHIRGTCVLRMGETTQAISILKRGCDECRDLKSVRYFRNALAVAQIQARRFAEAQTTLQSTTGETAELLRCHAACEVLQFSTARSSLEIVKDTQNRLGKKMIELLAPAVEGQLVDEQQLNEWRQKLLPIECELVRIPFRFRLVA